MSAHPFLPRDVAHPTSLSCRCDCGLYHILRRGNLLRTGMAAMDSNTERWLHPMFMALIKSDQCAFATFMHSTTNAARQADHRGVDWIHVGHHLLVELGWEDYPDYPPVDGDRFLDVVQLLRARGVAPTVANIARELEPTSNDYETLAALEILVGQSRLIKSSTMIEWTGDPTTEYHYYVPVSREHR